MYLIDLFGDCIQSTKQKIKSKNMVKSKQRTLFEYFWQDIFKELPIDPETRMPILKPYNGPIPGRMLAFDEAYRKKDTDCIVHFYEDDCLTLKKVDSQSQQLCFKTKAKNVIYIMTA